MGIESGGVFLFYLLLYTFYLSTAEYSHPSTSLYPEQFIQAQGERPWPFARLGDYRVRPEAVEKVKQAIRVFVKYVQENEPGTKMYLAWQEKNDPARFNHLFIFEDEAAQARHGQSAAVARFEAAYSPEMVGGGVVFTDYQMILGKPSEEQWLAGKAGSLSPAAKGKKAAGRKVAKAKKRSRR